MSILFEKATSHSYGEASLQFLLQFLQQCLLVQELQELLHIPPYQHVNNNRNIFLALAVLFNQLKGNNSVKIKITSLKLLKFPGLLV